MNSKKGKAIHVTGRKCPWGCDMSGHPHFVDSWPTDSGEVVSLMCWPPFTSRKIPDALFCYKLS
jgi:hypothetical protein